MAAPSELRRIEIGPVRDMAWGSHLCAFYGTTEDLLETVTSYFKVGLESREYCLWAVSGRLTRARATTALRQAIPDLNRHLAERSLEIVSAREWYLDGGRFDLRRVIRGWHQRLRDAEARGFAGMRVSGGAAWLKTKKEWTDFLQYEAAVNEAFLNRRLIALCSYPLATSGATEVLDIARSHSLVVVRRTGAWQAVAWRELNEHPDRYESLTPRERAVLLLAAEGHTNPEVSQRLGISVRTAESHRANLMRKLGLRNQTALVRYALQRGLLPVGDETASMTGN